MNSHLSFWQRKFIVTNVAMNLWLILKKANNIYLESEDNIYNFDKYGRLIAWVYLDNELLEKELLEIGYAKIRYIYGKYSYTEKLFDYENIAKEKKIGLCRVFIYKK